MLDTDDYFIVGGVSSIAIDSQNRPHILYTSSNPPMFMAFTPSFNLLDLQNECEYGGIKYAYYNGEWLNENAVCKSVIKSP